MKPFTTLEKVAIPFIVIAALYTTGYILADLGVFAWIASVLLTPLANTVAGVILLSLLIFIAIFMMWVRYGASNPTGFERKITFLMVCIVVIFCINELWTWSAFHAAITSTATAAVAFVLVGTAVIFFICAAIINVFCGTGYYASLKNNQTFFEYLGDVPPVRKKRLALNAYTGTTRK